MIFVSYLAIKVILRCWFTKHINEATIFKLNHPTLQKIFIEFYAGESTANNNSGPCLAYLPGMMQLFLNVLFHLLPFDMCSQ